MKKQSQATFIFTLQLRARRAMTIFYCCVIICAPILKKLKHTPQQNLQSYAIRTATETNINYVKVNMLLNCLGERSAGNIIVINKKSAPENTRSASAYRQTDYRYFASSSASASLADFCSGAATFSNEPPAFSSAAITLFDAPCVFSVIFAVNSPREITFTV